jgi:hypothetical protein
MPRVSIGDAEIHVPGDYNAAVGAFLREHRAP